MSETNDHGFLTSSTARTEATEAAVKSAAVVNAESEDDSSDEITEASATSKKNVTEDDLDDESIDSDDVDDAQGDQKPKKNSLKKRFSKLTQAKKLAESRALQLETELNQLRQGGKAPEEKAQPAKTTSANDGKPDPADFDSHVEYLDAYHNWRDEQRDIKARTAAEQNKALEQSQKMQSSYDEKVAEFKKSKPDFQEVIDEVIPLVHSQKFLEAIVSSDFGPQIAYELALNPKEIVRLQNLDAESLNRALGRLEAKFETGEAQSSEEKTVKKTNAPRPISPVGGSSTTSSKALNDPKIGFAEYERERLKQLNKK